MTHKNAVLGGLLTGNVLCPCMKFVLAKNETKTFMLVDDEYVRIQDHRH